MVLNSNKNNFQVYFVISIGFSNIISVSLLKQLIEQAEKKIRYVESRELWTSDIVDTCIFQQNEKSDGHH